MTEGRELQGNEIAVVGMAGRFPGARTLAEFWRNLEGGVESIRRLSEEELRAAGVPEAQFADPNYVRAAAILDDMEWWDAPFWGFTPLDASIMDPQHRLFLECAWEAFEDAGHAPEQFPGAIGVFAGCGMQAYLSYNLLSNRTLMDGTGLFLVRHTGNDKDFLSTRVSYQMNLRGPSVSVQTACSTSLVAIHMAAQSLLSGECDMALAGGATIEIPHRVGYVYRENEILSPDGHCRAFDAESKGTVFGSGAGAVVLRRLEDALRDGDRIHAVILGSAINNDGSNKVGYLAPSVDGQSASIVEALAIANVSPESIQYIETHGTGTPVGDPIEVTALTQAFRTGTDKSGFCGIGSLKSNIGHLDTAAGIAGLIKTVLSMQHRRMPPSLHFKAPNPAIDLETSPFFVNASLRDWHAAGPRRAGVSSLGVGGTNAHIVLEEAPASAPSGPSRPWQLITLSARTRTALDTATADLADHLDRDRDLTLADAAYTLNVGRTALKERRIVAARSHEEARLLLDSREKDRVVSDTASDRAQPAFLFAGGGAQFAGMGAELYALEPAFRQAVDACLEHLKPEQAAEVRALLLSSAEGDPAASRRLERPSLALPALFSTQYAMAKLLESWGIRPESMIGHSMGEYTAAHLAGVFSLRDAVRLVALRGRLFETVSAGAMLSVPLSEQELRPLLGTALSLAAVNAPQLCVASGPVDAIRALEESLVAREIEAKRLHIAVAAHSAMLEPILEQFGAFFRTITMHAPTRPFVSNETGTWITAAQATDPAYWVRHLRNTVRFADGIAELVRDPARVLVEVGPGRVLSTLARQHPDRQQDQLVMTTMRAPGDDGSDVGLALTALGRLWARGIHPDWTSFWSGEERRRVGLPTYPWERQRHWIEAPSRTAVPAPDDRRRPRVADWFARPSWQQSIAPPVLERSDERVLVFVDSTGVAARVAVELAASGRRVTTVAAGTAFERNGTHFTIRPSVMEDHARLLASLVTEGGTPRQVVFAWGITDSAQSGLAPMMEQGFHALLAFAQALANEDPEARLTLSVLTNDLQRIGGDERLAPEKALLLGPTRVMPREFPNVRSRVIDIRLPGLERARDQLASTLAREICAETEDETVALRGTERYVQELVNVRMGSGASRLRERGVYLITGGLGGIGYTLAEHLARTQKARLVLLGRGATAARAEARVLALESLGAEVEIVRADVTDTKQVRDAVQKAVARFGTLNGIFHAAGVLGDSLMPLKSREDAERVLAPKVHGTLALDEAVRGMSLDLFVCFSSVSAVAGLAGQADYAAANAFLDAFARERSERTGQFTVAVGWSAWRGVGMLAPLGGRVPETGHEAIHPLVGRRLWRDHHEELFSVFLSSESDWVVAEHRVRGGTALIPGTGYLELLRAVSPLTDAGAALEIRDVTFASPFTVADGRLRELRTHVRSTDDGSREVVVASSPAGVSGGDAWTTHARARTASTRPSRPAVVDIEAVRIRCAERVVRHADADVDPHMDFGPRWKNIREVRFGHREALLALALPEAFTSDLHSYALHPALMDMATAGAQSLASGVDASRDFFVPMAYSRLTVFAPLTATVHSHIRLAASEFDPREAISFDITIMNDAGEVLVEIAEFTMRRVEDRSTLSAQQERIVPVPAGARFDDGGPGAAGTDDGTALDIDPREGMRAIDLLVAGPVVPNLLVSPQDATILIRRLRGGQAFEGTVGAPPGDAPPDVGPVEQALIGMDGVEDAAVRAFPSRGGRWRVVAFVLSTAGSVRKSEMRRILASRFAPPFVPSLFVDRQQVPVTDDGKIDRERLSDPEAETGPGAAPRTDAERLVAGLWTELIGVKAPALDDDFFDIGGHSLVAIRLLSRMRKATGIDRPLSSIFEHPTLERFAALYTEMGRASTLGAPEVEVPPMALPAALRATEIQQGLWSTERLNPGTAANHVTAVRSVRGPLDVARLARALSAVIARHDALQLRLRVDDAVVPHLEMGGIATDALTVEDGRGLTPEAQRERVRSAMHRPFRLEADAPVRVFVLCVRDDEHLMLVVAHHLLVDGTSLSTILEDLLTAYGSDSVGAATLGARAGSFREWALRDEAIEQDGRWDDQLRFWRERLDPLPEPLDLSTGEREPSPGYEASTVTVPLPSRLMELADRFSMPGSTPFVLTLTALQAVLHRYTGSEDIAVAVPALLTAGDERYEGAVGLFINTLVLRAAVEGSATFRASAERARACVLDAWARRAVPFTRVARSLSAVPRSGRNPFFQVLLSFEQSDAGAIGRYGDLTLDVVDVPRTGTQAELAFYVRWSKENGALIVDYDTARFKETQVTRLAEHLLRALESGLRDPACELRALPLLSADEQGALSARQGVEREPAAASTVEMVARHREATPSAIAVSQGGAGLSYATLWDRAGRVAVALRARGVGRERIVGVSLERSPDLLVALLGIWRAGAAYLPLDPSFPAERLGMMVADAECGLLIRDAGGFAGDGTLAGMTVSQLEADGTRGDVDPAWHPGPDDLAYILFTSGSTGRPKGVEVPHGALVNFLDTMAEAPGFGADDALLAVTTLSFDIAGLELWLPLTTGGRVELATTTETRDATALMHRLEASGATVMQATPATWRMLLDGGWSGHLRRILCGGEAFPTDLVAPLCARADEVWNMYGPTETTIWSTIDRVEPVADRAIVPIGRPIANTRVFVMDRTGALAPPGVPGELWIGGAGVARGYRGRPDLTAERFVADPLGADSRAYRTGDLVRWGADGRLEHLGRLDAQVKVNGFRIELGEIEHALAAVHEVRQAVVALRGSTADPRLVAFVVFEPGAAAPPSSTQLRRMLRTVLPDYMVPSMIVELAALPLTPNGKVDRRALPDPFAATASRSAYEPPHAGIETEIAQLWTELLTVDRVSRHDNFFELGGHSLLAMQVVWRIKQDSGRTVDPRLLFFNSLAQIAEATR